MATYPWRDGQAELARVAWFIPRLHTSEQPPIFYYPSLMCSWWRYHHAVLLYYWHYWYVWKIVPADVPLRNNSLTLSDMQEKNVLHWHTLPSSMDCICSHVKLWSIASGAQEQFWWDNLSDATSGWLIQVIAGWNWGHSLNHATTVYK